jgi:exo-1,4-beta-D-glucosaminidase
VVVRPHNFLRIVISVALLLLLCAADFADFARPGPPPGEIELSDGWKLSPATNLSADGAGLSQPGFRDSD